jgi:hypothetical protein
LERPKSFDMQSIYAIMPENQAVMGWARYIHPASINFFMVLRFSLGIRDFITKPIALAGKWQLVENFELGGNLLKRRPYSSLWILGLSLSIFFGNSECFSAPSEGIDGIIAWTSLNYKVVRMLYKEKFDDLELMARDFRRTKARFPDGDWKLEWFYQALRSCNTKTPEGWNRFMLKFDNWLILYPNSITARVAAGNAWISYGWEARGRDYASKVTPEGWRLLKERLEKAHALVGRKPSRPDNDCPERYTVLLSIARGQGWDRRRFEELFREAITFEPSYWPYYRGKSTYLLPRWSGEEGEWQRFAQEAPNLTPKIEGKSIYMRILANMWHGQMFRSFNEPGISWPMMKQGFIDREKNFPGSPWNLNSFCRFAFLAGDKETSEALLARIGNRPYWEVWQRTEFQQCQRMVGIKDPDVLRFNPWTGTEDFRQYLLLAQEGEPWAQNKVGELYRGAASYPYARSDLEANNKQAFEWFSKAAQQLHTKGQVNLATMYMEGAAVKKDIQEAFRLNQLAAYKGDRNALFRVGLAYQNGQGIAKDLIKAYAWYAQVEDPPQNMKDLAARFKPQELQEGKKEADKVKKSIQSKSVEMESK